MFPSYSFKYFNIILISVLFPTPLEPYIKYLLPYFISKLFIINKSFYFKLFILILPIILLLLILSLLDFIINKSFILLNIFLI